MRQPAQSKGRGYAEAFALLKEGIKARGGGAAGLLRLNRAEVGQGPPAQGKTCRASNTGPSTQTRFMVGPSED
jgi:hypothetical protein